MGNKARRHAHLDAKEAVVFQLHKPGSRNNIISRIDSTEMINNSTFQTYNYAMFRFKRLNIGGLSEDAIALTIDQPKFDF